jgi:hypothetical protein
LTPIFRSTHAQRIKHLLNQLLLGADQSARLHMKAWNDAVFQMFEKTPASFRVNQLSAEIFEIQGKYGEAIAEFRKAIEKNRAALNRTFGWEERC